MTEPASIRYKNPGAMWGGNAISKKWGETGNVALNDGTGQGNKIAVFPTFVQGICAQIDLWRSARYRNKRFADAIKVWSGGNSVASYIKFVKDRVPGMTEDTTINDALLNSAMGIAFLKAQAWHEAGKRYPAPDADWLEAQRRVFGKAPASTTKKATVAVTTGAATTAGAVKAGISPWVALAIGVGAAVAIFIAWKLTHKKAEPPPADAGPLRGEAAAPTPEVEVSK
ncbi:hypothetical protein OZ411_01380 [Bradyrhizobium sp. Arg237L]|uniref:hypothetical protein n=1 Tax=Bradyrhizobium sp. Arg237L TaxID=3003352 RepID=UPI00249E5B65|nr:hypothetical protein [Bradyrhizobium sp. Arg237L]MDI4231465.1 hypothetical protein [Bradyrhizobium sp. Arg237L]